VGQVVALVAMPAVIDQRQMSAFCPTRVVMVLFVAHP